MQKWYVDYQRLSNINYLQALAIDIMGTRCSPSAVLKDTVEDIGKKSPHPN